MYDVWHRFPQMGRNKGNTRGFMGPDPSVVDQGTLAGRLFVDTMVAARELVRAKNYTLTELSEQLLKSRHGAHCFAVFITHMYLFVTHIETRVEIDSSMVPKSFSETKVIMNHTHRALVLIHVVPSRQ
jgi:hypothetical protein